MIHKQSRPSHLRLELRCSAAMLGSKLKPQNVWVCNVQPNFYLTICLNFEKYFPRNLVHLGSAQQFSRKLNHFTYGNLWPRFETFYATYAGLHLVLVLPS